MVYRLLSIAVVLPLLLLSSPASAQITFSGATETHLLRAARTTSPRALNNGRPTFGWRTDLFVLGTVSENVSALCDLRVTESQSINFDYLAIRLTDLTPLGLNVQAGKFDLPFGNLGERRFPRRNPLFGLPLIYEYRTSLPAEVSYDAAILAGRGRGTGMPLLSATWLHRVIGAGSSSTSMPMSFRNPWTEVDNGA